MTFLCDTNVWLALLLTGHEHHTACRKWLDAEVDTAEAVLVRPVQISVARLLTTRAVLSRFGREPLTNEEALTLLDQVLADRRVMLAVDEPAGLHGAWARTAARHTASPKLWMDAYLASWAIGAGWTLATTDRAFRQFAGLNVSIVAE